jgi:tRNA pseudouridine38-40 synthase
MRSFRLTLSYDGTAYVGWQVQDNGRTIQAELEAALRQITGESIRAVASGRTDAGVHALGQVAHIDLERDWAPDKVRDAVNFHLKPNLAVILGCTEVPSTFDARFSASARHYIYRILTRRARPVLDRNRVWWLVRPLDVEAMRQAAVHLVGRHDFTTFRAVQCQAASPIRTLDRLDVAREGSEIIISASARSFLHNQVRSMVGTLKLVGEGKWRPDDVSAALVARDRKHCGPVAPASGLYLARVDYPEEGGAIAPPDGDISRVGGD